MHLPSPCCVYDGLLGPVMLGVMMACPGRVSFNAAHLAFNAGLIGPGHAGLRTIRLVADLPLTHDVLEESVGGVHAITCQST